ncbi:hypothetical protein HDU97_006963 [Phlyctochytrium planicorne]|nr:hypothetical protein HDU97_006963 [Phlyctochytrium planicorne]
MAASRNGLSKTKMGKINGEKKPRPSAVDLLIHLVYSRMVGPSYFRLMVLRKILTLNDGRDKVLKCVQYGSKAILYLKIVEKLAERATAKGWTLLAPIKNKDGSISPAPMASRLQSLVSHMSMTRKIVRLAHFLEPIDTLVQFVGDEAQWGLLLPFLTSGPHKHATFTERVLAFGTLAGALIGIANDLSDDAICLAKMGVLDKAWSKTCTPISDQCWFASIFIDVHELLQDFVAQKGKLAKLRKEAALANSSGKTVSPEVSAADAKAREELEKKIQDKLLMHRVSLAKLAADFIFCTIDVFHLGDRGLDDGWQVFSGLTAAILGTSKLYIKNSK